MSEAHARTVYHGTCACGKTRVLTFTAYDLQSLMVLQAYLLLQARCSLG